MMLKKESKKDVTYIKHVSLKHNHTIKILVDNYSEQLKYFLTKSSLKLVIYKINIVKLKAAERKINLKVNFKLTY